MSIASELTNLAANRDAIKAAIEAKSPTVAPTDALSSFPAAIESIPSGGGSSASPVAAMYGWPDIKAMLEADTEDFAHKAYVLFDGLACPTVPDIVNGGDRAPFKGAAKAVTSDGATYTAQSTHTWDRSKLASGRYGWIAYYSSTGFTSMSLGVNYSNPITMPLWAVGNTPLNISSAYGMDFGFSYSYTLVAIDFPRIVLPSNRGNRMFFSSTSLASIPPVFDVSGCTNLSQSFSQCTALQCLPSALDISSATNTQAIFHQCRSLTEVPAVLDFSSSTNCSSAFQDCNYLRALPDVLDFGASTNNGNAFQGCYRLEALPTHLTANRSVSFVSSTHVTDRASVATFVNGAITDGFVGNLNTCNTSGQTITLNSAIKGLFTASEQSAIETMVAAKNWTLTW